MRRALGATYDHLGTVLLASALVTLAGLSLAYLLVSVLFGLAVSVSGPRVPGGASPGAAAWLPLVLAGMIAATLMGPLLAGLARLAREILAREDPAFGDLFREARRLARPGALLAALQAWVTLLLVVDLAFFAASSSGALRFVAVPFFYLLLFWGLMLPYQWPLLAEGAGPPLVILRKSALLVLDNLSFSLGVALLSLLFSFVCAATTVGLVLLWPGTLAFFHSMATRALLRRYGLLPLDPEPSPEEDDAWRLPGGP